MTASRGTRQVGEFVLLSALATVLVGAARGSVPAWMWAGLGLFGLGLLALVIDDNRKSTSCRN